MYWDRTALGWVAVLMACGPVIGAPEDESTSSSEATSPGSTIGPEATTDGPQTSTSTSTSTTSVDDTGTVTTDDPDPTVGTFLPAPDFIGLPDCDLWKQDCPRGEKCMPWANDGGSSWNATRCSPLDPNPAGIGEACMVEGSGVSGIDNCDISAMCWDVDPETNMGECIAFCQGSEANPSCADECASCSISGGSVLALCLPGCDPIAQNCDEGDGCYATNETFSCVVDASDGEGAIGAACEFINGCDPGSACLAQDYVPGCDSATGCCAPFCSLEVADPCEALLPGSVCMPWWEEGQAPPDECVDQAVIGVCIAP